MSALDVRRVKVAPMRSPCIDCGNRGWCLPCDLNPEQLHCLEAAIRTTWSYRRDEPIYRTGEPFKALFLVKSGSVKIQQATAEGGINVTGLHFSGDLLGLDAIGSTTYPSEAVAARRTTLCIIPFDKFEGFCAEIPGVRSWLLEQMGKRLKAQESSSTWRVCKHLETRVLRFFWELYQWTNPREHTAGVPITLPVPKCDIARYLNMTPETFSRTLTVLRSRGLIEIRGRRFHLPDVDSVRGLAGD